MVHGHIRPLVRMSVLAVLATALACKPKAQLDAECVAAIDARPIGEHDALPILARHCPDLLPSGCPEVILATKVEPGLSNMDEAITAGASLSRACLEPRCNLWGKIDGDQPADMAAAFIDRCGVHESDLLSEDEREAITHPHTPEPLPDDDDPARLFDRWEVERERQQASDALSAWMLAELVYAGGNRLAPEHRARLRQFVREGLLEL